MVSDTRSSRNSKDEGNGCNSRKKTDTRNDPSIQSSRKSQVSGSIRSDSTTQTAPSPQSIRKSKRLEKGTPPSTPSTKRKSERREKHNTPSPVGPVRRSVRSQTDCSPDSSKSTKPAHEFGSLDPRGKEEKNLTQVTMGSEKAEITPEVGMKRKQMSARSFMSLFKKQRIKIVADGDGGLERQDNLSDLCGDINEGIHYEPTGNGVAVSVECSIRAVGDSRDKRINIDKASGGALQKSTEKGFDEDHINNVNKASSHRENVQNEHCSNILNTSPDVRDLPDCPEILPINCSSAENVNASESANLTRLGTTGEGSVCSVIRDNLSPSLECGSHNLIGTCVICSKQKRLGYNSPKQVLCSCNPSLCTGEGSSSSFKGRSNHKVAVASETAENRGSSDLIEMLADSLKDGHENICALCNKSGELLYCAGKCCKRFYHTICIDPQHTEVLPGVWHCPQCVKKKLLFGVHSVSEGVESIWDATEVEVPNGVHQKQYLVKYHGLAHIHNHWVPEQQLVLENSSILSNFIEKDQPVRWSLEWTKPHRLLRKRSIQDNVYVASSTVISVCNYEWLVKWHGLGYDHATWELDNASWLSSPLGQNLVNDYETRCEMANQEANQHQKGPFVELSELPASQSLGNYNHVLKYVNKLRHCLFKCQNVVMFYDQELVRTILYFLQSMSGICRPFLIVTASSSLSQWEAEFARLVPPVDVVVYSGNKSTRKGIRAAEFYGDGGCVMLQVLLSSVEAVFEDLDELINLKWEAIVVDDYQQLGISNDLEKFKILSTNLRILLVCGQIKDTTSEYFKMLLLLESHGDLDKLRGLKSETSDNLCKLKDRLSRFIAYGSSCQLSKFNEYWVPVQISNYQLEHYCSTLLNNSIHLRSCSKTDLVGAHRDVLVAAQKCCDHPYLLDLFVQERLFSEKRPFNEILEVGIQASGKLELLDKMLAEIHSRGLQVLVLYQAVVSGASIGNYLDDFIRQRFGPGTYERVEHTVIPSKRQAAVNRFNNKQTGQFIFLLENRSCSPTIKFPSLDVVIIYNSDWNPANDLRALQKLSIGSKAEQIKVFRLYSSFTVEERALVLAKKNLNLDNNLQSSSRAASDTLLSWGAVHLFGRLDEYHANGNSGSASNPSGQLCLSEVAKEFESILFENADPNSMISKVKLNVGSYSVGIPLLGETQVQLKDGEELHVFWRNLLDGRKYNWKHLRSPSSRNRKRIQYSEVSSSDTAAERDGMTKKLKKMVDGSSDPTLVRVDLGVDQVHQIAVSKGGSSRIKPHNQSENLQKGGNASDNSPIGISGSNSGGAGVSEDVLGERIVSSDERKTLHSSLEAEMMKLCQVLQISEDVTATALRFLEYVIKNHDVNSDSQSVVQALQISLCWMAAAITKTSMDKKESLMLAKQHLSYQCTEEQANSVYFILKEMYSKSVDKIINSGRYFAEESISKEEGAAGNLKKLQKKIKKRRKKLIQCHKQEFEEFHEKWDQERSKLETDHKLDLVFVKAVHGQSLVGVDKLKLLNDDFEIKMKEFNLQREMEHKALEARHLITIHEEERRAASWLAEAESNLHYPVSVGELQSVDPQPEEPSVEGLQPCRLSEEALACEMDEDEVRVNSSATIKPASQSMQMNDNDEAVVLPDSSSEHGPNAINTSEKNSDGGKVTSPDGLANDSCGPDEAAGGDSQGQEEPVVQSQENAALPDCANLSSQKVQQDAANQSSVPAELPDVETQNDVQIQTETIDTVTPSQPYDHEAPMADESAPHVSKDNENTIRLQTDIEIEAHVPSDQETAAPVPSHQETVAQSPSNPVQDAEVVAVSDVPVVVSSAERPSEAIFQVGTDTAQSVGPSYVVHPSHQPAYGNSAPSSLVDPLQIELENLRREIEQLDVHHKELVSRLQSDCEKEIQELINQIRSKYNTKLLEIETEFRSKKNELEQNQNKVRMNRLLAAAFRAKCRSPNLGTVPGKQQGFSAALQHQHRQQQQQQQLSTLPTTRPHPLPFMAPSHPLDPIHQIMSPLCPPGLTQPTTVPPRLSGLTQPLASPSGPPGHTHPIACPPSQTVHAPPRTHPARSSLPAVLQSARPAQNTTAPHFSSPTVRPSLVIGNITPSRGLRSSVEIRSAAPHLQPFRPPTGPRAAPPPPVPHLVRAPPPPPPVPHLVRAPPQAPPLANLPAVSVGGSVPGNPSQPAGRGIGGHELPPLTNLPTVSVGGGAAGNPSQPGGRASPLVLPDISSKFGTLEASDLEILGKVPLQPADVVCLSDDE